MAEGEARLVGLLREQLGAAHWLLEETMKDVTAEMAHRDPGGIALPIGAAYAHSVTGEDWIVNALLRRGVPLLAGEWAGRTGLSESPPGPDPSAEGAAAFAAWCRRVRLDLPAFRRYARAVYDATDAWLSAVPDSDIGRTLDLSAAGIGSQTVGFVINNVLIGHAFCHCGEISALKGIQGKRGYPF